MRVGLLDEEARTQKLAVGLLVVITLILVGMALRATYIVTLPLVLAFFLALLVRPIQTAITRRVPRWLHWLGTAVAMLALFAVLALAALAVFVAVQLIQDKWPEYRDQLSGIWQRFSTGANRYNIPLTEQLTASEDTRQRLMDLVTSGISSLSSFLAMIGVVFFLVLLMLIEAPQWPEKVEQTMEDENADRVLDTAGTISQKLRKFLLVRSSISLASGIIEGTWLWLMGVDLFLLWGMLYFVLNFVPTVGSLVASVGPALLSLVQFGFAKTALIMGVIFVIEQVIGNYIAPRWQGRALNISPVVLLLSLVFWTWAWGAIGALITEPLTVTILIVCMHVPALRPLGLLISSTADEEELEQSTHSGNGEQA